MMPQINVENPMVVDWYWNEIEYGVPSPSRLRRIREAYEQAEREEDCNDE